MFHARAVDIAALGRRYVVRHIALSISVVALNSSVLTLPPLPLPLSVELSYTPALSIVVLLDGIPGDTWRRRKHKAPRCLP